MQDFKDPFIRIKKIILIRLKKIVTKIIYLPFVCLQFYKHSYLNILAGNIYIFFINEQRINRNDCKRFTFYSIFWCPWIAKIRINFIIICSYFVLILILCSSILVQMVLHLSNSFLKCLFKWQYQKKCCYNFWISSQILRNILHSN